MLNKDLLRYHFRRKKFLPTFVEVNAPNNLEIATNLLELFQHGAQDKLRQCELAELTAAAVKGALDPKLAAGLNKLLLDRTSFAPVEDQDFRSWRHELFTVAAHELKNCAGDFSRYQDAMRTHGAFAGDLYGDLPDFERLQEFRTLTAVELLHRYNLAQVQGLLLYTRELKIKVSSPEAAELRRLLKFMKFFRLLAELQAPDKNTINLTVSGPFALFDGAKKYALQLAAFFPAVVKLPHWTLHADLDLAGKTGTLELNESAQLVSHYRNISNYIPEEIRMYHQIFDQKSPDWKIVGHAPFINAGGGEIIFPDLSFKHRSGKICHLELFHRWHRAPFERRLEWLAKQKKYNFIVGVDRAIASDDSFAAWQKEFPDVLNRVFRFRDFPGVAATLKLLKQFEV